MPDIFKLMRAIRRSALSAPERHTLLTLTSLVDPRTGLIPDRFQPSLTDLTRFTGLGRSTIVRALNVAEMGGWIKRTVPTKKAAQTQKEKTSYALAIPDGALDEDDEDPGGASATLGLVPQRDQPEGWCQCGTSATAGLGLVPQRDGASATVGHKNCSMCTSMNQPPPSEGDARDEADPVALFSVPGQREATAVATETKTAPKKAARPKRQRMSREITKTAEALPADWFVSDEMKAWAKEKAKDVIERLATEKFLVYFGDGRKKKSDWDKTWRNWLLNDQQRFEERSQSAAQNGSGYAGRGAGNRNGQRNQHIPYRDPEDISRYKTSKI